MSNIFDANAELNKAKEGLVSDFTSMLTFNSLCKTIKPENTVDLRKSLAGEFKKSAEFIKVCDEIKSKATITDLPYGLKCTKIIKFDDIYSAHLIPESEGSIFRNEENGSITERWHLYRNGEQIGSLAPDSTDFNNEDEVLTRLANMVAQSKSYDRLALPLGYFTYSDPEM